MFLSVSDLNYINVYFDAAELIHGYRYVTCVHADATTIAHERWPQELPEINECSDGVTLDLTPPLAGDVWIGNNKDIRYQVCRTSSFSLQYMDWE